MSNYAEEVVDDFTKSVAISTNDDEVTLWNASGQYMWCTSESEQLTYYSYFDEANTSTESVVELDVKWCRRSGG